MAVRGQVSDVVAGQDGVEELEARVAAPEARISVPLSSAQAHGTGRGQLDSVWEVVVQVLYQLPVVVNLSTPTGHTLGGKLQAPVYENLPSTNTVFSYAIGSKKLSDNEQFFCWSSDSSKFVTNNSAKTRRFIYSRQQSLHQTNKTTIV